jgi:ribosomal protein S27AE
MTVARFDGHYGRSVDIDVCSGCNGLWFDQMENHALTPGATLKLFREMGAAVEHAKRPLQANKRCPRCGHGLMPAVDKQRSTSFETFRCREGHGRYMTFTSFLRAKSFIRDLTPAEVHDLRRHVRAIKCTNCAAAVDITKESSCSYCRAPIAMLDPEQLANTISELEAAEQKRQTLDPSLPLRLAHERLKAERVFTDIAANARAHPGGWTSLSLVDTGLSSIVHVLDALGYRD